MNWLLIGMLLGSTVISQHDTREACEGRAVVLKEKGANVKCELQSPTSSIGAGTICFNSNCSNNTIPVR